jgi:hypothetical protein
MSCPAALLPAKVTTDPWSRALFSGHIEAQIPQEISVFSHYCLRCTAGYERCLTQSIPGANPPLPGRPQILGFNQPPDRAASFYQWIPSGFNTQILGEQRRATFESFCEG